MESDPCPAYGCKERPGNSAKRVEVATIDDPAKQIPRDGSGSRLQQGNVLESHLDRSQSDVMKKVGREAWDEISTN